MFNFSILSYACDKTQDTPPDEHQTACTEEAKECPDGSFVSRVPPNCEFQACPEECNYEDPLREYVGKDLDECARLFFQCEDGKTSFTNSCVAVVKKKMKQYVRKM